MPWLDNGIGGNWARARREGPQPPLAGSSHFIFDHDAFRRGEYEETLAEYRASLLALPMEAYPGIAAIRGRLDRFEEAAAAARSAAGLVLGFSLASAAESKTRICGKARECFLEGLRKAGVPAG